MRLAPVKDTRERKLLQPLQAFFFFFFLRICVCSDRQKYGIRIVLLPLIFSYMRKKKPHALKSDTVLGHKTLGDRRKGLCN